MLTKEIPYFPLYINLSNKKIIVIGGGKIAARRIAVLLDFGCFITVIAPDITCDIKEFMDKERLKVLKKTYEKGDLKGADMVLAATNNRNINREIYIECTNENILINVADCKEECSFYFPAIIKEDSLVIGITASGKSHTLVREVAQKIRSLMKFKQE